MENREYPTQERPQINPEVYKGKKFFHLSSAEISTLPNGTTLRACGWKFRPFMAIVLDDGTRDFLTSEQQDTRDGYTSYGFLEGDRIPENLQLDDSRAYTIKEVMISADE